MAYGVAVIKMEGGFPVIAQGETPYTNYVSLGDLPGSWGLYLVADTQPRLVAADTISGVYGICLMTQDGEIKWAELDNVITPAMRTKINTWLTNQGYPTIPVSWTNRRVVRAILDRINPGFNLEDFWVIQP